MMDGFPRAKKVKVDLDVGEKDGEAEKVVKIEKSATNESSFDENDSKRLIAYSSPSCLRNESAESTVTAQEESSQTVPSIDKGVAPSISGDLLGIEQRQYSQLLEIKYPAPVTHVYNPLSYASQTHQSFVHRYGNGKKRILFVGMNPGPFGMAQNGVPFGDTTMVKEWLGIAGDVSSPANEHPKRAIQGLNCTKNEVSGTRFWNLMRELCSSPEVFFKNCYVHNYCPLCFMAASGKNITPPMLRTLERRHLEEICNQSLIEVIDLLGVEYVVGIGKYAEERAKAALVLARESRRASAAVGVQVGVCGNTSTHGQTETHSSSGGKFSVQEFLKSQSSSSGGKFSVQEFLKSESLKKDRLAFSRSSYTDPNTSSNPDSGVAAKHVLTKESNTSAHTTTRREPTLHPTPTTHSSGCHSNVKVYGLMHPSPINPAANKGWNQLAIARFGEIGILEIIKGSG